MYGHTLSLPDALPISVNVPVLHRPAGPVGFRLVKGFRESDAILLVAARGDGYRTVHEIWPRAPGSPRRIRVSCRGGCRGLARLGAASGAVTGEGAARRAVAALCGSRGAGAGLESD